ncbi:hypothetical protein Moror_10547 [Moniliophthora roreri MCA 2997]|uniref:Uncharacterized protein n=1 Tax=Moniliophthora roreri (strain MCA 2997) TaxID=1381753 RepID=V2XG69_MONRO|nr:hypothetical protein Moror_10547 [Moniliophthora roreri MCA 2997]
MYDECARASVLSVLGFTWVRGEATRLHPTPPPTVLAVDEAKNLAGALNGYWDPNSEDEADGDDDDDDTDVIDRSEERWSDGLKFPTMLLHRLGSFSDDMDLKRRKEDIFSGRNTFLLNTSGSGKTRLLFEGLCDHWGLYLTCHVDSGLLGSADVQVTMVDRLDTRSAFVEFPTLLPESDAARAISVNIQLARRYSGRILLARLLVFKAFLDCSRSHGYRERKLWLHFQLQPNLQTQDASISEDLFDVFLEVCEAITDAEVDDTIVDSAIAQTSQEILDILGGEVTEDSPIFLVLDEANVAANKCERSFRNDHGDYYPLLKAMLQIWREYLRGLPYVFVVAGTKIPKSYFDDESWADFIFSSNTGGFDAPKLQQQYIQSLVPGGLLPAVTPSLPLRVWSWLRGRHRFTSAYIAVLLEHSFAKPSTYLDMVVHQGTGYFPHDVHYDTRPPSDIIPFARLDFIMLKFDRRLRSYIHLALMDTILSSSNPGYSAEAIILVNEGMGRFTDSRCSHIVVDEPLIIARAVTWFSGDEGETPTSILNYQYFIDHLVDPGMAPRHPPAYLAFALALVFGRSRRVSEILALSKPIPTWSRRNADIVARKQDGDGVMESPVRHVDHIHRTLVTYSATLADTLSWMRRHHRTPFCIHLTETTATLIFIVKLSNNTRFWAIMRDTENPSSDILDALDSLPSICPQVCPHGVLPVIAVLGKDIEDIEPDVLNGSDSSRVALVRLDELSQALDLIPPEQIAERIINAITRDPEKAEEEAEEEVEETMTRTKAQGKTRASGSNQSRPRRPRGSSVLQHGTRASGTSHATVSGTSRYNLRPRIKSKAR